MNSNTTSTGAAGPTTGSSSGLKSAIGGIHGAGEALRGTINSGLDSLAGDKEGVAKNQQVAERGFDSMDDGHLRRQNHAEAAASRKATGKDVSGSDTAHVSRNI